MPWEHADTIACIYLTAMLLCLVFGGIIGWAMRGWHEEKIQAGVENGVNKS